MNYKTNTSDNSYFDNYFYNWEIASITENIDKMLRVVNEEVSLEQLISERGRKGVQELIENKCKFWVNLMKISIQKRKLKTKDTTIKRFYQG